MEEEKEERLIRKIKKKSAAFTCILCHLSTLTYSFPLSLYSLCSLNCPLPNFCIVPSFSVPGICLFLFPRLFFIGLQLKPSLRPAPSHVPAPPSLLHYQATETEGARNATQSSTGEDGRAIFVIKWTETISHNLTDAKKQYSLTTEKY